MNILHVKGAMEQIHISEEMQEELIVNIQERMEHGNKRAWSFRKMAAVAAAFVLTAGVVSFPVQAVVKSIVKARMESVPAEEVKGLNDMVQSQHDAQADGFSREYSDREKERSEALWQAYEDGTFPEKVIAQAESAGEAPEGMLCYIRATGVFNLPVREMTDEELLEIIDFQQKMSYAVEQESAVQTAADRVRTQEQADEEDLQERAGLEAKVQAAGGISEEEAVEIAKKAMESDLGEKGKGLKLHEADKSYGWRAYLWDITDWDEYKDKGEIGYSIQFDNVEEIEGFDDLFAYECMVNAIDGSICGAYERVGLTGNVVWYEH